MARRNWKQRRLDNDVLGAIKTRFELRYPNGVAQVITDAPDLVQAAGLGWDLAPIAFVAGDPIPPAVATLKRGSVMPLLAFDCDDSAARMAEYLIDRGIPYIAASVTDTALYMHVSRPTRQAITQTRETAGALGLAHVDVFDFCNIAQFIDVTREVEGKYVEVGVFNGVSGMFALNYMRLTGVERSCVFMDVFEGFVYAEALKSADAFWMATHVNGDPMDIVAERLRSMAGDGVTVDVRRHNIISDEFPGDLDPIAVANLDVDMYDAVYAGLLALAPRMAPRGVIICEDAGHSGAMIGARVAVNKFLRTPESKPFMPIAMESGQVVLVNVGAAG